MAGQSFVMKIYQALKDSALWEKSMLVIVYDEHGGFYDHVDPTLDLPTEFTDRAEFGHVGPRVPAIVVSPFVEAGAAFGSAQNNVPRFVFDHNALIKTILLRFADGNYDGLPERVESSSHLGHLLTGGPARVAPEIENDELRKVTDWWARHIAFQLKHPSATVPALQELGIVQGPAGPQAAAQGLWSLPGSALDWIKGPFSSEAAPARAVRPTPASCRQASQPRHATYATRDFRPGSPERLRWTRGGCRRQRPAVLEPVRADSARLISLAERTPPADTESRPGSICHRIAPRQTA
jgi:hypothetical protein